MPAKPVAFDTLVETLTWNLSRSEKRVARYFVTNRHETLLQSAMQIAKAVATSDATVLRTVRALGFEGLEDMRRAIAGELSGQISPASRISRTVLESSGDLRKTFEATFETQLDAITKLRNHIEIDDYATIVRWIAEARETAVFGIGPSNAMAEYFCTQLRRFGLLARALNETGLLLADQLLPMKPDDFLIVMAYGRVYAELDVLISHAARLNLNVVLLTDSLEKELGHRVTRVVRIARGRSNAFSMHTATLAFLESLLVGVATLQPGATIGSLELLNELRTDLAGRAAELDLGRASQAVASVSRPENEE